MSSDGGRNPTVLIIEDDKAVQRLAREVLESYGYGVLVRDALGPALDELSSGFSPHCVVVDLNLPNGRGLEIVRQLLDVAGRWPIVIVTGEYDDRWAEEAYNLHPRVQQYVLKTRINWTEKSAEENRGVTLAKLVADAMSRSKTIQRQIAAETAKVAARSVMRSGELEIPKSIVRAIISPASLRWLTGAGAAALVVIGGAISKWGSWTEGLQPPMVGTVIAAVGGALAVYVLKRKG